MRKMYVVNDTVTGVFSGIYDAWKEERTDRWKDREDGGRR